jgi:hypothetical protein
VVVTGSQNDGNDSRIALLMSFDGTLHFPFVAVIRSNEIRAYKQEDDIRCVDVAINRCSEILSGRDTAIMPR